MKLDAEPVDELREHVLSRRRRAEPVLGGGRLAEGVAELEWVGVGEPRTDDRQRRGRQSTTVSPMTSFAVVEREMQRLEALPARAEVALVGALARPRRAPGVAIRSARDSAVSTYDPWIPARVRGSTIT